jgi:hypothetical protein
MDEERFAGLLRALGSGATRRGALGVLAGLAGLGLSGVATRGKAEAEKVDVCHYNAQHDAWVAKKVSLRGWDRVHSKHEQDFERGDCCNDSECSHLNEGTCYIGVCDQSTGTCSKVFTGDGGCLT